MSENAPLPEADAADLVEQARGTAPGQDGGAGAPAVTETEGAEADVLDQHRAVPGAADEDGDRR